MATNSHNMRSGGGRRVDVRMNHKEIERWHRLRNLKRASQILVVVAVVLIACGYRVSRFVRPSPVTIESPGPADGGIRIDTFCRTPRRERNLGSFKLPLLSSLSRSTESS